MQQAAVPSESDILSARIKASEQRIARLKATLDDRHAAAAVNKLLDRIMFDRDLKNDAALSRFLNVAPPQISKLRSGHTGVSADFILRVHEIVGWNIRDIKDGLGMPVALSGIEAKAA